MSSSTRLLLLCPGQGDQHTDMYTLARSNASASALLDQLGMPPFPAADTLFANRSAQPLIVAAALATWQAIREFSPPPALVAGYSVGELSAYGVAGALAPADTIALARLRAQLMDDALATHPGQALLAVAGVPLAQMEALAIERPFYVSIETG